jgi:hypothetical protein
MSDIIQYIQSIYFLYYLLSISAIFFLYFSEFVSKKKVKKKSIPSVDIKKLLKTVMGNDRKFYYFK